MDYDQYLAIPVIDFNCERAFFENQMACLTITPLHEIFMHMWMHDGFKRLFKFWIIENTARQLRAIQLFITGVYVRAK